MDYFNFLNSYHPISTNDYDALFSKVNKVHFKKGDFILEEGQIQRDLYFVYSGVQMGYYVHNGKEHVMMLTYPHSLSGIANSFLTQTPSEYCLKALTDTEFGAISFTDINNIFEHSQQIERLFRKMIEIQFMGLINRHKEFHAYSIEERFMRFMNRSPHLLNIVPHKYIASYLHIDPTNFSKLYNSKISGKLV